MGRAGGQKAQEEAGPMQRRGGNLLFGSRKPAENAEEKTPQQARRKFFNIPERDGGGMGRLRSRDGDDGNENNRGWIENGVGMRLHPDLWTITSLSATPLELEETLNEAQFTRYDAEADDLYDSPEEWIDEDNNPWYSLPKERILQADQAVGELASSLHEEWREGRLQNDGSFEPRVKETKDDQWIAAHNGQREVDIANTSFSDLPGDWQAENHKAAEAAVGAVMYTESILRELDYTYGLSRDDLHELAASEVHGQWLERNGEWAEPHQNVCYFDLSPEEKKKDRDQVESAFRLLDKISNGDLSSKQFH
jgi:hypothetical protein